MMGKRAVKKTNDLRYEAKEYSYNVAWSDEDEAFLGRVVEFPSLAAHGDTLEDALHEINQVVELVLEDLAENGEPIPEPISKKHFSGKLNLRMPSHLHRQLSIEADREGVSLNQWITMKLASPRTV
jgi:predicted HicB family RNase H-like nuclease